MRLAFAANKTYPILIAVLFLKNHKSFELDKEPRDVEEI